MKYIWWDLKIKMTALKLTSQYTESPIQIHARDGHTSRPLAIHCKSFSLHPVSKPYSLTCVASEFRAILSRANPCGYLPIILCSRRSVFTWDPSVSVIFFLHILNHAFFLVTEGCKCHKYQQLRYITESHRIKYHFAFEALLTRSLPQ